MFLQMQNRRQFLERSAWGFGSAFVLPSLLQSCTDHVIPPDPNPPYIPPVYPGLGDSSIDWNDASKKLVVTGLEFIPEVGEVLGPLVDILWPSTKEDVWGEIKAQVEALIKQEISKLVYQLVSEDLGGLQSDLYYYQSHLKTGTPAEKNFYWGQAVVDFGNALPHFQSNGAAGDFRLLLLPLFAQFANLHVNLLREPLLPLLNANGDILKDANDNPLRTGTEWGMTDGDLDNALADLKKHISDYISYATDTYTNGRADLLKNTKPNNHLCEPFRTVNAFDRQMTLTVLDFKNTWKYYDPIIYLNSKDNRTKVELPREIYSDPFGTCDDSGPIVLPSAPTQRPTQISVWGYDRIDAVQLTYPANSGPNGVTTTARMGNQNGGTNQPPHGIVLNPTPDNPIIGARTTYGDIVNTLQFRPNVGQDTAMLGGNAGWGSKDSGMTGYNYEALSSIHINGVSKAYGSADCVVFGFQYWLRPTDTLETLRAMYIRSPDERTLDYYVNSFPKLAIPADLINDELKAYRKAYWEYIKTRVK